MIAMTVTVTSETGFQKKYNCNADQIKRAPGFAIPGN